MLDVRVRRRHGDIRHRRDVPVGGGGHDCVLRSLRGGQDVDYQHGRGTVRPDEGHIIVGERRLFDSNRRSIFLLKSAALATFFRKGGFFPTFRYEPTLLTAWRLTPKHERYVQFDQVVELLGIAGLVDRRPTKLSGGEKQRVAIGRALLTSPSALLNGRAARLPLILREKPKSWPFIARLAAEFSIPILYVSHSLEEILNLADVMVVLDSGHAVASGRIEDLMSRSDLQRLTGYTDCGAVISTVVESNSEADGISYLRFPGGVLKVPRLEASKGCRVRVRIEARHVAIALVPPEKTSVQNILPGTVEEITFGNGSFVDVKLNIGCQLLARITPLALRKLE